MPAWGLRVASAAIGLPESAWIGRVTTLSGRMRSVTGVPASIALPSLRQSVDGAFSEECFSSAASSAFCFGSGSFFQSARPRHFGNPLHPSHGPRLPVRRLQTLPHFSQTTSGSW